MSRTPEQPFLADEFNTQHRALRDLGYQLLGLLSRAMYAMYPAAAYVTVTTDSADDPRFFTLALAADGSVVHDFVEDDDGPLPELPATLAAEFGRYDPRDRREVQLLLNDACDTGAQLSYLPEQLLAHAEGDTRCLALDPA